MLRAQKPGDDTTLDRCIVIPCPKRAPAQRACVSSTSILVGSLDRRHASGPHGGKFQPKSRNMYPQKINTDLYHSEQERTSDATSIFTIYFHLIGLMEVGIFLE